MKTKLAKQTYLILIFGLLFSACLITLVAFQFRELSQNSIYSRVAQMNLARILNDPNQKIPELKRRLEGLPGIHVQIKNVNQIIEKNHHIPIFKTGEIRPPFDWGKPLLIEYHGQLILINFSPINIVLILTIVYSVIIFLLVLLCLYLAYWAIRRLEKINLLAQNALHQLEDNVYASVTLPLEHSEAKILYQDIQKIQNMMQGMIQKRTQTLAAISHDLKTPITRIKLRSELLEDNPSKENLLNDINHLENLVGSIITFSKNFIDEETPINFDFSQLINSICEDYEDIGKSIDKNIKDNILYHGRITAIKRAILNIFDNAFFYGKENIAISLSVKNKKIICQISDSGCGLDPSLYEKVFEPFYRGDLSRHHAEGSGLGLSISKEIIEAHGGYIKLLPNKPQGLIVEIYLSIQ